MHEYLTYAWLRDEPWLGHRHKSQVVLQILGYRDQEDLRVFQLYVSADGRLSYQEIPRGEWIDRFGVKG